MKEEEQAELTALSAFITYMAMSVLIVAPVVVLVFYFSDLLKDDPVTYTRSIRVMIGFGLGCLLSMMVSGVMTWRAIREPFDEEEEEEEDEEDEDEEEEDEEEEEEEEEED